MLRRDFLRIVAASAALPACEEDGMIIPPLRMLVGQGTPPTFYSSKVLNSDWNMTQSPSALYVASTNKTIVAWCAVGLAGDKCSQVAEFNHTTNTWSRRYNAGNYTLADDDHGHPALVRDADGYFHIFYGSHASGQPLSSSNAPDDITAWTQHAPLSGTQTYPHPVLVGSTIYLLLRNDATLTRRTLVVRSTTPTAGVPSFGAMTTLIDLDADSRVYTSEAYAIGTDIHFTCTRANGTDSIRQHVYYFVFDTVTGAVKNHDGSFSVASGSLPVTLAQANANFRLLNIGATGRNDIPSLAFDSNGDPHVEYIDNGGSGAVYTLRHIKRTAGVWSAPTDLATIVDQWPGTTQPGDSFVDFHGLVPGAGGTMQAWYQNDPGDKLRRVRSASGVWSAEETIVTAGSMRFMSQQAVRNAHPSFRSIFAEVVDGAASDAAAALGKRYAHGDSGLLSFAMPAAGSSDAQWSNATIMAGFDHRDASARFVNESDSGAVMTGNGNAQVDTAQSKFGGASLLLDGTGDFVTLAHNAKFSVSNGDFCVDMWVKRNASKLQALTGKRPSVGTSEWIGHITAGNVLQLAAFNASVAVVAIVGTLPVTTGWHHVRFNRQGSTWRQFLDGVLDGSAVESASPTSNTTALHIGRDPSNTGRDFNGWIDEYRFTSGNARETSNFTPPSAAFPRI